MTHSPQPTRQLPAASTAYLVLYVAGLLATALTFLVRPTHFVVPVVLLAMLALSLLAGILKWPGAPVFATIMFVTMELFTLSPNGLRGIELRWRPDRLLSPVNFAGAGTYLISLVAVLRYLGLTYSIFPPVTEEGKKRLPRSAATVEVGEFSTLIFGIGFSLLLASAAGVTLATTRGIFGYPPIVSRLVVLVWLIAPLPVLAGGWLSYQRWGRLSGEAATTYLQDIVWHDHRREQRRIQRWWVRAKLRQERSEAKQ